MVTTFIKHVRV